MGGARGGGNERGMKMEIWRQERKYEGEKKGGRKKVWWLYISRLWNAGVNTNASTASSLKRKCLARRKAEPSAHPAASHSSGSSVLIIRSPVSITETDRQTDFTDCSQK